MEGKALISLILMVFFFHKFVIAPKMEKTAKIKKQNLANTHLTKEKWDKIMYYLEKTKEDMNKKIKNMSESDILKYQQLILYQEEKLLTEVNFLLRKEKNELKVLELFEQKVIEARNQCIDFLASLQQSHPS